MKTTRTSPYRGRLVAWGLLLALGLLAQTQTVLVASVPQRGRTEHLPCPPHLAKGLSQADCVGIRGAREHHRGAAVRLDDGGNQALHPDRQWLTRIDERGFTIGPGTPTCQRGLEPSRLGFAGRQKSFGAYDRGQVEGTCHPLTADPLAQQANLTACDTVAYERFGLSVAVSGGTADALKLSADSPAGGAVWVGTGGRLHGRGAVAELTIDRGGHLSPGESPGTILAGNTTWAGGGNYDWEINDATGSVGADPGWDLLEITGTLDIVAGSGDKFAINLVTLKPDNTPGAMADFDAALNYAWTIVRTTAGISGFAADKFVLNTPGVVNALGGGSFALSVSGKDLVLAFNKAPPHAATLAWFRACRMGSSEVSLSWQTLVEVQVLGFRLERSLSGTGWVRVTTGLIPAEGSDYRPHVYQVTDTAAPLAGGLLYRLIEVDLQGAERVVAEADVSPCCSLQARLEADWLRIELRGAPVRTLVLETTTDLGGSWVRLDTVRLDSAGQGTVLIRLVGSEPTRFFRAIEP